MVVLFGLGFSRAHRAVFKDSSICTKEVTASLRVLTHELVMHVYVCVHVCVGGGVMESLLRIPKTKFYDMPLLLISTLEKFISIMDTLLFTENFFF